MMQNQSLSAIQNSKDLQLEFSAGKSLGKKGGEFLCGFAISNWTVLEMAIYLMDWHWRVYSNVKMPPVTWEYLLNACMYIYIYTYLTQEAQAPSSPHPPLVLWVLLVLVVLVVLVLLVLVLVLLVLVLMEVVVAVVDSSSMVKGPYNTPSLWWSFWEGFWTPLFSREVPQLSNTRYIELVVVSAQVVFSAGFLKRRLSWSQFCGVLRLAIIVRSDHHGCLKNIRWLAERGDAEVWGKRLPTVCLVFIDHLVIPEPRFVLWE